MKEDEGEEDAEGGVEEEDKEDSGDEVGEWDNKRKKEDEEELKEDEGEYRQIQEGTKVMQW